jgi:hypothetical protein
MEKRINEKIEIHTRRIKEDIMKKLQSELIVEKDKNIILSDMLKYINEYEVLKITQQDIQASNKPKRMICDDLRCKASRVSGEQCSRRSREGELYCGTHMRNAEAADSNKEVKQKKEKKDKEGGDGVNDRKENVWLTDNQGIMSYVDASGRSYKVEDIMKGVKNPRVLDSV